jgi:hypothetical protein
MFTKKLKMVLLLLLFASALCPAQEANGHFWNGIGNVASFGKPFWADMHSTLIRAETSYATNSPDYDWRGFNTSNRLFIFSNLGVDIPVWSGNFAKGKYGFSLTLPFMIDVWYDRFEWITSPVINTSYRFGTFDLGFIDRLDCARPVLPLGQGSSLPGFLHFNIYNWAAKLSLFKHESTHIGDELTIRRKDLDLPITRIDVAYNYAELVFTLNDPDGQSRGNHGFKSGFLLHYNFKKGWYDILESEAQEDIVLPSRIPFELYIQYQYQSPLFSRGFQIIASAEYRLRERYKYPFSYSGAMNDSLQNNRGKLEAYERSNLVNCFNFFAGLRYDNQKSNYFSKIGIGTRYYVGINPYGQFRSMPYFQQIGLAVIFE